MWCISICEHWFIQINVRIFASYVTFVHFIYIHKWTRKIKHMTVSNQQDILLIRCFHSLNRYVIYSLIFIWFEYQVILYAWLINNDDTLAKVSLQTSSQHIYSIILWIMHWEIFYLHAFPGATACLSWYDTDTDTLTFTHF